MQKKRSIKIISIVLIIILICISIMYFKNDSNEFKATTKEFNLQNLQDNENMHVELDNSGDKVPVPNGYVGSRADGENEIDTGYVIYEGEEEVNNENLEEAQKTRNQYVWIPVPDVSTMYGTDENGKKWGKLYNFATTSTDANYDNVTGAYPLNWNENNGIMKILDKTKNREPDIVTYNGNIVYDMDSRIRSLGLNIDSAHKFLIQLEKEFNSMIDSVNKYGGFYIGRYETGDLSKENLVVRKENINISGQSWYTMYEKCKKLKNNNSIETGIIWGSQWDRTLIWLIETENKTKEEICKDSTSWGNYVNATFEYINSNGDIVTKDIGKGTIIPTGSTEYTKANNIYDLAGNVWDWTMESFYTYYKGWRGGQYYFNGYDRPSSNRNYNIPTALNKDVRFSYYTLY